MAASNYTTTTTASQQQQSNMSTSTATSVMTTSSETVVNHDTSTVYKDLMEFLQSPRHDLRLEATKAVLQVVHDRHQVLQLLDHGVVLPLLRIASDSNNHQPCANSLQAMLYLTSAVEQVTNTCVEELLQHKAVPRLVELVLSLTPASTTTTPLQQQQTQQATIINLALAILANLTRTEQGAVELVGTTLPDHAVPLQDIAEDQELEPSKPTLPLLLDRYLNRQLVIGQPSYSELEPHEWDTLAEDPYQHFAAILMNATQLESGRNFVLKLPKPSKNASAIQEQSVFQRLLPQLQSPNPLRRRGISGMIRNCCLEKDAAWWMLNVIKLTTPILYPLMGPEALDWDEKQGMDPDLWLAGPDKEREIDISTRQHLVDAILLLCASGRQSRKTLRLARTYVVLKYADMVEESEAVSESINECVQYLRRDEEGTEEGSSDRMVEEEFAARQKLASSSSSQVVGLTSSDYDDVD